MLLPQAIVPKTTKFVVSTRKDITMTKQEASEYLAINQDVSIETLIDNYGFQPVLLLLMLIDKADLATIKSAVGRLLE